MFCAIAESSYRIAWSHWSVSKHLIAVLQAVGTLTGKRFCYDGKKWNLRSTSIVESLNLSTEILRHEIDSCPVEIQLIK